MKKSKWYMPVILAAAILAAAGSWLISGRNHIPVYQSEATLVIGRWEPGEDLSSGLNSACALADAFEGLLNSSLMGRTVLEEQFDGTILAERVPETNLLDLKVLASEPETAFRVIQAVLEGHTAVTERVMGPVPITVIRAPQLPDAPANSRNYTDSMVSAAIYAALFTAVLCIWHFWAENAAGMESNTKYRQELDLPKLLVDMLRQGRKIWVPGVGMIVACALGLCAWQYAGYQPVYEMSASFTVRSVQEQKDRFPSKTADQLAKSIPQILTGDVLIQRLMENLALEEKPELQLSVSAGSGIMTLTVRDSDPGLASEMLSAILSCYPEVAEYVVGPTKLCLLEQSGIPDVPINPFCVRVQIRNGACIGFVLWMIAAMLLALYRTTVHSTQELSELLECHCCDGTGNCMGVIGHNSILLITGALPGEGKSTAAWELALSLAKQGKRVLLADCNPRNATLTKKLGFRGKAGVSEYLNGYSGIGDIIHKTGICNLYAVSWGASAGYRGTQSRKRGARLQAALRKLFDCVILDGPSVSWIEEIAGMAELADGAILVVRKNRTAPDQIREAEKLLREWGLPVLGSILVCRE